MKPRSSALLLLALVVHTAFAQVNVLTNRNDGFRTGANLRETILNSSNVNSVGFGKLFSYAVDGSVYAQPLYVSNLAIPGRGSRNVVFIATMNDSVYAFDADKNATLWSVNFTNPTAGITPVPISDVTGSNALNIVGFVGITSTPVIELSTKTIYLVARTKEISGGVTNYVQRLHALDITTGAEKFNGPVVIAATVSGTGEASVNGKVSFDPFWHNQRPGLALAGGQVIIAWASHEDDQPYHGWVMAYDAATLQQTAVFCTTPNGKEGGIWMSGRSPVVDAFGDVYLFTGNGSTDKSNDFSEAALRFSTRGKKLTLTDYFIASNYNNLNSVDLDLASSGPLMLPKANLLVGGGKQGILYLLDPADLGKYASNDAQIPQKFQAGASLIFPGAAYWQSASLGPLIYLWTMKDKMHAYHFNGSTFDTTPAFESAVQTPQGHDPGGALSISASGAADGTGILWAAMPLNQDADHGLTTGMLRALNATTGVELWNSQMNAARDATGPYFGKFVSPTVANGKVYVANFTDYSTQNYVNVFGLLP